MKKDERKKLIPAVCVFVFVAFSFVIANAFGDTYAVSACPSGYKEITSASTNSETVCCPENGNSYLDGQCWAKKTQEPTCTGNNKLVSGQYCCPSGGEAYLDGKCWADGKSVASCSSGYSLMSGQCCPSGTKLSVDGECWTSGKSVASCSSGYNLMNGQCCPSGTKLSVDGECWTSFESEEKCPSGFKSSEDVKDGYSCVANPGTLGSTEGTECPSGFKKSEDVKDGYSCVANPGTLGSTEGTECPSGYNKTEDIKDGYFCNANPGTVSYVDGQCPSGYKESEDIKDGYSCAADPKIIENTETTYTVKFNPNGGTWADGSTTTITKSASSSARISFSSLPSLSKTGCTFEGWYSGNQNDTLGSYADIENAGETLRAQWSCEPTGGDTTITIYNVSFYDELGESLGDTTVNEGETISDFPSFKYPQLEHFWSDSASCDSGYEFAENSAIVSDLELYQCYSEGFIVEFYDEYREYLNEVEVFPVDIVIPEDEIPDLDKGYEGFWSEYKTCKSEFDVEDEMIIEDIKLYACYTYDIYFYGLDEAENYEEYKEIGNSTFFNGYTLYDVEDVPEEDDLLIEGKVFTHWSTSSNSCEEEDMLDPEELLPLLLDGVNLYACYTSGEAILVRFNDMHSNKITEIQVVKGTSINDTVESTGINIPTAPTEEGYKFKFWSNGSSCSKAYNFDNKVEQPLTLTACYNKNTASGGTTDDNVDNNPGTGSFMLYVVFLIGILSLGYTGYSVVKVTKKNN